MANVQWSLGLLVLALSLNVQATEVEVVGLFKNAAVLRVNGQQRVYKAGELSPEGVRVVSASTREAVIEIDGKRQTLGLSRHISSAYSAADKREVEIPRSANFQYITHGHINGKAIPLLVDTGANSVAMSERHARQLGIDYLSSKFSGQVQTASGTAKAYGVQLRSVSVGGITASGVEAVVIQGDYPTEVLLGVSFLQHVDLREENGVMYLKSKF